MLDIKDIRENPDRIKKAAKDKGYEVDIDKLLVLDEERVRLIEERDKSRSVKKTNSKPDAKQIVEIKKVKEKLKKLDKKLEDIEKEWSNLMLLVPNIPSKESPIGDESKNKEIKKEGSIPKFSYDVLDHVELAEKHNLLDIERAVKIGGTRSYILKNELVILEQAVLRFAIDTVRAEGFEILNVPVLVKSEALIGSGFFPFGKDDIYEVDENSLYLVGTSEASLVYYHAKETIQISELPKMLSGISTCFRKEVGTYGKDNRGVIRVHQFNKVEQVVLCREEEWEKIFNFILNISERILKALELPYRVIEIATGDMGAKNVRQNDLEVWFPSQNKYRETHSCSYLGDFQARRANIKYVDEGGQKKLVHTLNNTAIATPRILAAILENHQQKDGSIKIPEALQKYTGFKEIK